MSDLVIAMFQGDTVKFRQAVVERGAEFAKIAEAAPGEGALHHRSGVGDRLVVVRDERETARHLEQFFANPELQAFIGSVGGDLTVAPEITIAEAIESGRGRGIRRRISVRRRTSTSSRQSPSWPMRPMC
jgi:hypothetical protein